MTTPLPSPFSAPADTAAYQLAFDGQYVLERELGRGGMGIVYLARDVKLDRPVAIKVLPGLLAAKGEIRERFVREARTAAKLSHPSIVPVYRADELRGVAFFVMAYVEGESLGERIRDRGALPAAEVVRWLRAVALGLGSSHAAGVVHRDVKPENILIERASGRALISDFGIARVEQSATLTEAGHIMGTAAYMSPEQVNGDALDGRSDLYSLGVVGFHALAGRLPFEASVASALLVAHATKPAPPLGSVAPEVPRELAEVIDRCLRKPRDERYATAEQLEEALARAAAAIEREALRAGTSGDQVLSEAQAAAIWKRAAQLQAEAAARLEKQSAAEAATRRAEAPAPTEGFRARDVELAAVEAGISQRFVALALAETRVPDGALPAVADTDTVKERAVSAVLGTRKRSLSASRVIRSAPREVLQALGRAFQSHPYDLFLADQVGAHPLDGGVLVFEIGGSMQASASGPFKHVRWSLNVKQVRATLRPIPGDPHATEVTVHVDLRPGIALNVGGLGGFGAAGGVAGAAIGLALAKKAVLALSLAGGAGVGAALFGGMCMLGTRWYYQWAVREAEGELEKSLAAIQMQLRSASIFGEPPPALRPPPPGDDGTAAFIASVG